MIRVKKNNQIVGPILIGCIVLVVGLAFIFLNTRPEYKNISTIDGGITVAGDFPHNFDVKVQVDAGASQEKFTAVVEKVYTISPDGALLPAQVAIRMPTRQRELDVNFNIGFFDTSRSVWVPIETRRDDELGYFEASTRHFSSWTLLRMPNVVIGSVDSDAVISSAFQGMPPGTQSYTVDIAYATVDGDYVLLRESVLSGRCADVSALPSQKISSATDREVTLNIDGKDTKGSVRAIVNFEIGSGCSDFIK